MILTGKEIHNEVIAGNISIDPFDPNRINPNSYNLTLNSEFAKYQDFALDMKKDNPLEYFTMPESGFQLQPFTLYLASTNEATHTDKYVPILSGRSSVGRLGISVHVTAGFGDIGFRGKWTLEIFCTNPVRVYPNVQICQIYFEEAKGERTLYQSKYQGNYGLQGSMMYRDFAQDHIFRT